MKKLIASYWDGCPASDFHATMEELYYIEQKNFKGYKLTIHNGTMFDCQERGWKGYGKAVVTLTEAEAKKAEKILNSGNYVDWESAEDYFGAPRKNRIVCLGHEARVR